MTKNEQLSDAIEFTSGKEGLQFYRAGDGCVGVNVSNYGPSTLTAEDIGKLRQWLSSAYPTTEHKDCRLIKDYDTGGERGGYIISESTVHEAHHAIRKLAELGHYKGLLADDASMTRGAIAELELALAS